MRRGRGFEPRKVSGAGPNYQRPSLPSESLSALRDKSGPVNANITICQLGKNSRINELSVYQSTSPSSNRDYEKTIKILLKGLFMAKATIHFVGLALDKQKSRIELPTPINYHLPLMPPKYPATKVILSLVKELEDSENQPQQGRHIQIQFTLPRSIPLDHFLGEVLNPDGEYRAD